MKEELTFSNAAQHIAALTEANKEGQVHSIFAEGIIATLQEQLEEKDKHIAKLVLEVEELLNNQTLYTTVTTSS